MTYAPPAITLHDAMTLLHWNVRDLFAAAFAYGDVGTEADLAHHVRSGDRLTAGQLAVVTASVNDALLGAGEQSRLGSHKAQSST